MRISSRTPEGQPLECGICGQRTHVLVADPPGDSVCPRCGCFAWLQPGDVAIDDFDWDENTIPLIVRDIAKSSSRYALAEAVASGLNQLIAPDEIVVWGVQSEFANCARFTPLYRGGGSGDENFARCIVEQQSTIARRSLEPEAFRFKLGAPLLQRKPAFERALLGRAIGAVELSYVRDLSGDAEEAVGRLLRSLAAVSAGHPSLRA